MTEKETPHPSREHALGKFLLNKGAVTETQLQQALDEKEQSGRRIGDILVEHGWATTGDLAHALAAVDLVPQGLFRPLADRLPLPLSDRNQNVQHQPAGGRAGVDGIVHRQELLAPAFPEIGVDQVLPVGDGASEPVQLDNQEAIRFSGLEHSEGAL